MLYILALVAAFGMNGMPCSTAEKVTDFPDEFDFIVVGAGAAGAAAANRLSEDGSHRVLLLEAGGQPQFVSKIPYFGVGPFHGPMDWDFLSEPNPASCRHYPEQRINIPRGKTLGGSTAINAMMYVRCNKHDYDQWAAMGNKGWDYEHVLPFFKKMESYGAPLVHQADGAYHGDNGPVQVERPAYKTPVLDAFVEAGKEMGYDEVDYNAAKQTGFSKPVFIMHNGTRWTTNDAYIQPAIKRPNFVLLTEAFVTKVLFNDGKKATGILFENGGKLWRVKCHKEVILSAGSIGSPHLLLLSGIGPLDTLRQFKIPVVHELPGVGQNLKDHVMPGPLRFRLKENTAIDNRLDVNQQTFGLWETERQGPLSVPIRVQGIAFVNSRFNERLNNPDIEIIMFSPPAFDLGLSPEALESLDKGDGPPFRLDAIIVLMRPKSVGNLTLRSSDPHQQPAIHLNLLSHPDDVETLLDGMKLAYRVFDTKPFRALGIHAVSTPLHGCEQYETLSDDALRCQMLHYTSHLFHPLGTCKMGPQQDHLAVVDATLRVRGVEGLRVADASIMPTIMTGHTMAPAILIGERVAAFILDRSQRTEL